MSGRRRTQCRTARVGERHGGAAPVVRGALPRHQTPPAHSPQLVGQPALLPRQRLPEFVHALLTTLGETTLGETTLGETLSCPDAPPRLAHGFEETMR